MELKLEPVDGMRGHVRVWLDGGHVGSILFNKGAGWSFMTLDHSLRDSAAAFPTPLQALDNAMPLAIQTLGAE